MLDVNDFSQLRIGLATADKIRMWSNGEVKKPETINYRTLKPEKDGLFCEKIFGPTRDWECDCGKYKRVRFKGIICERCGVEVTRAKVRRERMGHIELAAPVTHIWYFKGVPSRLGYLLDLAPKDLEKVIYFAAYMITYVDDDARARDLPSMEAKISVERGQLEQRRDSDVEARQAKLEADLAELEAQGAKSDAKRKLRESSDRECKQIRDRAGKEIDRLDEVWSRFKNLKVQDLEGDELLYREMRDRFGRYFRGGMGAQAIQDRLASFDLDAEAQSLRETIRTGKGQKKARALKRLKVVSAFLNTRNSPMGMVLDCIPVIPPDLRPMVQLDGGRFATSDLNDLYRRVINRNNRLKRLVDLGAPETIVNNEKGMLQEVVDPLFANGRRGRPVTGPGNRRLKSLSDMLKGKQGRFRQNLLGKRVDYSGRSVIVSGPQLKLHQCGLPKQMALELFKPFVMRRLVDLTHAQNIKSAKRMVERARPVVWDVLEEVITEHRVLLNRAPTLHRLGIQAFEPQLVEGKAIQIHPLVCTAFNADFDGDQMAVHVPLSAEAQAEARILMRSTTNTLKPADGKPVTMPTQDMVIGIYCLTRAAEDVPGQGRIFGSISEATMAYDTGELDLQAKIQIRLTDATPPRGFTMPEGWVPGEQFRLETTLGRCYFNETLPTSFAFVNYEVGKKQLSVIVNELAETYPKVEVAAALDALKDAGFHWATRAGVTIAIEDVVAPPNKAQILESYEKRADKVQREYERGLITDDERRQELIEIWTHATADVARDMEAAFPETNSVWMMVNSGARGNLMQVRQIAGMRGLVSNPKGETIPRPIKASFRAGLSVLEDFISTHRARQGLAGTQLTMRTFHTGGVAGQDITHGLPRIQELFEARIPKGMAPISEVEGRVKLEEPEKTRKITIVPDDGSEEIPYQVPMRSRLLVADGDRVTVGQQLIQGAVNPHEVLRILGSREVQMHLVHEVQEVYRSQGVSIHDKHIEIIIRQMLKRVNVLESGDTELLPGELVERPRFEEMNRSIVETGGTSAAGRPVLMGITKASLATESWLSAASFQETTRVLTDPAIHAKSESLVGLKENVIIGKLIPSRTGMPVYPH